MPERRNEIPTPSCLSPPVTSGQTHTYRSTDCSVAGTGVTLQWDNETPELRCCCRSVLCCSRIHHSPPSTAHSVWLPCVHSRVLRSTNTLQLMKASKQCEPWKPSCQHPSVPTQPFRRVPPVSFRLKGSATWCRELLFASELLPPLSHMSKPLWLMGAVYKCHGEQSKNSAGCVSTKGKEAAQHSVNPG